YPVREAPANREHARAEPFLCGAVGIITMSCRRKLNVRRLIVALFAYDSVQWDIARSRLVF
ncbi:MAG: hypothetical protein JSU89_01225, partial [Myxococcales bacterium]